MMERLDHKTYSIGDLVSRYGVAAQSLRNWEDQGFIPPARRTPGKHRRYGAEHVQALDALLGYRPPVPQPLAASHAQPMTLTTGAFTARPVQNRAV
ncbi:MAG: MerR family DNA-binding transcriptional regulator [Phycisphaeraceae bacterium]